MPVPTYDGLAIFGDHCSAVPITAPRGGRAGGTFGLNGIEWLDGGARGGKFLLAGSLQAPNAALFTAAELLIRSYNDGKARVFTDQLGTAWNNAILGPYEPSGRIVQTQFGGIIRPFRLTVTILQ